MNERTRDRGQLKYYQPDGFRHVNPSSGLARPILLISCVMLAAGLLYAPSLSNGFVGDDFVYLLENYLVRHPLNAWKILNIPEDGASAEMVSGFLRSRNLRDLSYAVDYWIWGMNPGAFHATNIVLHLIAVLLVFRFGACVVGEKAALIGAAFFALHPANTEVAAWISGRKDALAAIFMLLSLIVLERQRESGRLVHLLGSLLLFAAAFFCKEEAAVLPGLILAKGLVLGEGWKRPLTRDRGARAFFLFAAAAVLMVLWRSSMITEVRRFHTPQGFSPAFLVFFYTLQFLFPISLQFDYRGYFHYNYLWALRNPVLPWLFAAIVAVIIIFIFRKNRTAAYLILWFYIALAPLLHVVRFHIPAADRFLYIPGIGLCLCAGLAFQKLGSRYGWKIAPGLAAILFLLGLGVFFRVPVYQSGHKISESDLRNAPSNPIAVMGLQLAEVREGPAVPSKDLVSSFESYLGRLPDVPTLHFVLADLYERLGNPELARRRYEDAIRYGKRPWEVYVALSRLEIAEGGIDRAEELLGRLIEQYGYHPESYILLGIAHIRKGAPENALAQFQKAAAIDLHSDKARFGIMLAEMLAGRISREQLLVKYRALSGNPEIREERIEEAILGMLLKKTSKLQSLEVM